MKYLVAACLIILVVIVGDIALQTKDSWMDKTPKTVVTSGTTSVVQQENNVATRGEKNTQNLADNKTLTTSKEHLSACDDNLSVTECLSQLGATLGDPLFIRIFKQSAELEVWIKVGDYYELLRTYPVCKQSGHLGPKLLEGDMQGPEGFYAVSREQLNPNSRFHLSFDLGFPNAYDSVHNHTGSALMVHGDCVSVGCFAMTDEKIEEIYALVEKALASGQGKVPVHVFPFRMDEETMLKYSDNEWYNFWGNLKEGYDYFEEGRVPPVVTVVNRRYEFE